MSADRVARSENQLTSLPMLNWTLLFLLVALTAGVLGFGGIAGTAATIAKICFIIFLAFFVAGLLARSKDRKM